MLGKTVCLSLSWLLLANNNQLKVNNHNSSVSLSKTYIYNTNSIRIPEGRISLSAVIHSLDLRALELLYGNHLNVVIYLWAGRPHSGNIVVILFKLGDDCPFTKNEQFQNLFIARYFCF